MFKHLSGSWLLLASVFLGSLISASANPGLTVIHSWKSLDFDFPTQTARDAAIQSKEFIPGGLVPIDLDVDTKGGRIFITVPRSQDGVPVTLGYITSRKKNGNPLIAPFPSWEMQKSGENCSGLTSVWRIAIDSCGRLWVLDAGKINGVQICPPKLLVYSLGSDRLLRSYTFPKSQYKDVSLFVTPVVDIRDSCNDPYVYIADVDAFSLIVYDHKNSRSWRIVNKLFYPYPDYGTLEINKESFDLMDGILGLALGPLNARGDRRLYFHSLASRVESYVPTSIIRNQTIFANNAEAVPRYFRSFRNPRSSQSAAEVMDQNGVLFYGLMSDMAIGCWNSKDFPQFGRENIEVVVKNKETLQFASGMKVISEKRTGREELWVITNSYQKLATGSLRPNVTNFRIQAAQIDDIVRGTKCEISHRHFHEGYDYS